MVKNNEKTGQNEVKNSSRTPMLVGIILVVLVAFSLFFAATPHCFSSSNHGKYTVSNIGSMNIDLRNAKIHMEAINGNEDQIDIEVAVTGKYQISNINIETKNKALYIKQTGPDALFSLGFNSSLEVYVKVKTTGTGFRFDDVIVSSKSGRITVRNIGSQKLAVRSESGKIVCTNVSAGNASVSGSSAKIVLNQINVTHKLTLRSQSGEIQMNDTISDELSVHSKAGAINAAELTTSKLETATENGSSYIVFSNKLKKISASSSSTSGSIAYFFQNDIPLDIEWTGKKMNCKIEIDKDASNKINIKTDSGNLSVSRR